MDEEAAWSALLGVPPGEVTASGPLSLSHDGGWTASIDVTPEAATLLDIFGPLRATRAWTVGQLGQSVDGRIATESGHSHYINGPDDIRRLHRLRAVAQAVIVGAGTVASDDPRLTVRHVDGPDPVRVVLDPTARLDPGRGVFQDGVAPTMWIRSKRTGRLGSAPSEVGAHVEAIELPTASGRFAPNDVLAFLETRGLLRVLVEGGGVTVSSFLEAGVLDRLHLSVAPLILGSGRPGLTLPVIETLDDALRPSVRHFTLGSDLLFDLELRGWSA